MAEIPEAKPIGRNPNSPEPIADIIRTDNNEGTVMRQLPSAEKLDLRLESEKKAEANSFVTSLAKGDVKGAMQMLKDSPDQKELMRLANEQLKEHRISMQVTKDGLYIRRPSTLQEDPSKSAGTVTVKLPLNGKDKPTAEMRDWTNQNPETIDGQKALDTTMKVLRDTQKETDEKKISDAAQSLKDSNGFPTKETAAIIRDLFKRAYESGGANGADAMERQINKALEGSGLAVDIRRAVFTPNQLTAYMKRDGDVLIHPENRQPVTVHIPVSDDRPKGGFSEPRSQGPGYLDVTPYNYSFNSGAKSPGAQLSLAQTEAAGYPPVQAPMDWSRT